MSLDDLYALILKLRKPHAEKPRTAFLAGSGQWGRLHLGRLGSVRKVPMYR